MVIHLLNERVLIKYLMIPLLDHNINRKRMSYPNIQKSNA